MSTSAELAQGSSDTSPESPDAAPPESPVAPLAPPESPVAPLAPPPAQVWPCLSAHDARGLVDFLVTAFGFVETVAHTDDAGRIVHAELAWPPGGGIMLGGHQPAEQRASAAGTFGGYAVTRDAAHTDEIFARAVAAGATVGAEPYDTDYGSHDCALLDPEGNRWQFGTYPGHARGA